MDNHTYTDNIASILQQSPVAPTTMAVLTQTIQTTKRSVAAYSTHAQLEAIARMQAQLEPVLRIQEQLASMNAAADALTACTNSLRLVANPLQGVRSALSAIDSKQFQSLAKSIYRPQMAAAIQPALGYLEQEHPDVYREIVPDEPPQPVPESSALSWQNTHIRRRALDKANQLVIRADITLMQFDDKLRKMPLEKLSFYLTALSEIGDTAPDDIARSIHILVAIFMISRIIASAN